MSDGTTWTANATTRTVSAFQRFTPLSPPGEHRGINAQWHSQEHAIVYDFSGNIGKSAKVNDTKLFICSLLKFSTTLRL
jgi:hypothetical protein